MRDTCWEARVLVWHSWFGQFMQIRGAGQFQTWFFDDEKGNRILIRILLCPQFTPIDCFFTYKTSSTNCSLPFWNSYFHIDDPNLEWPELMNLRGLYAHYKWNEVYRYLRWLIRSGSMEHRVGILSLHVSELRYAIDSTGPLVWTRVNLKLVPDLYFIRILSHFGLFVDFQD